MFREILDKWMHKTFHFALKDVLKNEPQMTKTRGEKVRINIFYMITIFSWKLIVGWGWQKYFYDMQGTKAWLKSIFTWLWF